MVPSDAKSVVANMEPLIGELTRAFESDPSPARLSELIGVAHRAFRTYYAYPFPMRTVGDHAVKLLDDVEANRFDERWLQLDGASRLSDLIVTLDVLLDDLRAVA